MSRARGSMATAPATAMSIQSAAPDVAVDWHPVLNRDLLASQVRASATRWAWWLGPCGHEWQDSPSKRVHGQAGCPVCSGERTRPGVNDLATTHPDLAERWDQDHRDRRSRPVSRFGLTTRDFGVKAAWFTDWASSNDNEDGSHTARVFDAG